jgi:putative transposase
VFGVEPICRVLSAHGTKIAPSTHYAAKSRPASLRAVREEWLKTEITRIHTANYRVYGARKVWRQLQREGHRVARCTAERLMRELGLHGARRGRSPIRTLGDDHPRQHTLKWPWTHPRTSNDSTGPARTPDRRNSALAR